MRRQKLIFPVKPTTICAHRPANAFTVTEPNAMWTTHLEKNQPTVALAPAMFMLRHFSGWSGPERVNNTCDVSFDPSTAPP